MLRGSNKQNHFPTSANKAVKGYSRPAPNTSFRQEDSVSSTSRVVDETQETNPEEVGGGQTNTQGNRSMAQVVSDEQNRQQLQERRRCQLLIDIRSKDGGAPTPSASMIYQVLTEQLGLSKDPSNGVQAIYAPNPGGNSWRWLVLFNTENLKTKFQGKTTTRTFKYKETKTDYTYTFITRRPSEPLLITIKSSPLILDEELGSFLEQFGKIAAIVRKPHDFAQHIDSSIQQIFLILHKDVKTTDIRSLCTSDGVWRKLFFKGKSYICKKCGTKHTHTQRCPTFQHDHFDQQ